MKRNIIEHIFAYLPWNVFLSGLLIFELFVIFEL